MTELGKTLAQARVARGLTLDDCERDTRISKRYLDALEREDWRVFPAPVYSRAFLRTYAQYLGLDAGELMRLFQSQSDEPEIKPLPEIAPAPATGSINWVLAGGVVLFLLIAGSFIYFSSTGSDPSVTTGGEPTSAPEALGGGEPPLGRAIGEVTEGEVPNVTGAQLDEAIGALETAGMSYIVVETDAVEGTAGVVASQDPAAGTEGDSKTSVTLVVPRG